MNTNTELYERDFFEWTHTTAKLIRDGAWWAIDADALAEEIESLGKSQQHELENCLYQLVKHLLKWRYQPKRAGRSWRTSINNQRVALDILIENNHSLRQQCQSALEKRYLKARKHASAETELPLATFPLISPWTLEQILNDDFWPDVTS
jgi:hypothetical protein